MDDFPIIPGSNIKNSVVYYIDSNKIHQHIRVNDIFTNKISVVFGGPAPFSKLDTEHAELYERFAQQLLDQGVEQVVAIYCQDAFVCKKFQEEIVTKAGTNNVKYYADGDGFFTNEHGIGIDFTCHGLSLRSARWCAVIDNIEIVWVASDEFQLIENTHPQRVLEWLESQ